MGGELRRVHHVLTLNLRGAESSVSYSRCSGMEYHHPIMNTLWGHRDKTNRQTDTISSAVRDVISGVLSLLLPPPMPLSSFLIPRDHITLTTPPSLSPISQAHHHNAASFVVVPKSTQPLPSSPIPCTPCLFLVLCERLCCCNQLCGQVIERLLTFWVVDFVFLLMTFCTCDCCAQYSTLRCLVKTPLKKLM